MTRDLLELGASLGFIDEVYERYQHDPADLDPSWREAFGDVPPPSKSNGSGNGAPKAKLADLAALPDPAAMRRGRPSPVTLGPVTAAPSVWPLVNAYRTRGHFAADLDPLDLIETAHVDELDLGTWGFSQADLGRPIEPTGVHGMPRALLGELVERLRSVYCGSVGIEVSHIASPARRSWLAERMETRLGQPLPGDVRRRILQLLINAEQFERFCHTKFPGTKRFSLEGSESLIPALDLVLTHTGRHGAIECVLGMAHRGRLTALEQILRRPARELFAQFEDVEPEKAMGGGDVKYHLGFSTDRTDPNGHMMHVSLAFNPSHLEAVDPVVVGRVRAKQTRARRRRAAHASSACSSTATRRSRGRASSPETLQLSGLPGYRTGGTVHIIVNNQVGFTASPAERARRRTAPTSRR